MLLNYKKIVLIVLGVLIGLSILSCRKGENDPFISLRSRKARITGTWNLSNGSYSYNSPGIYNLKVEYDGDLATEYVNNNLSRTYVYTVKFKINKDYSFERVTIENGFEKIEKGNWFFNEKSKNLDLKSKEAIILSFTSVESSGVTTTYSGANADEMLLIDRLKNDELIFKGEKTYSSTVTDTEKYEYTYLQF
ncbi:MAG: hypothetical protein ABF242_03560 [Flavobacteriales bacterium]